MRVVVWIAWARLRHRPARWLLVALGVAAATVLPVAASSAATVVAAQALRYGVESLPPGDRSLAAIRSAPSETPQEIAALDTTARSVLADLSAGPVLVQMLTRAISDGVGGTYYYGAADGLTNLVRVTEGRAPASCTPTRCEVLLVGSGTPTIAPEFGLVIVGRAVKVDPLLLAGSFDPGDGSPLLLADGVSAAAQLEYLAQFQRSYSWVTPVDLDRVNALGVDEYLAHSQRASIALYGARLTLTAPDEELRAEAARAQLSARRFALLSGSATALLLGFCVIGAIGLRRDHTAAALLLRRRGARNRHVVALAAIAGAVPVLTGVLLGAVVGGALAAWQAGAAGLPAWASALASLRAAGPAVGIGALAATVVVAGTLLAGASARAAWRGVDVVVAAGAVTAALALARGAVTTDALSGGTDPLLLALPVIVVVGGGLLVGRAWPALTAAAARLVPRRLIAPRLGLVGAVRNPLRPVATAAFLAAAVGIVTFAGAYQATLRQGATDQAAFAVPLDATVRVGASLRTPLEVATPAEYQAAGLTPYPVVRSSATVRLNAVQALTPELVGVDPAALPLTHQWSDVVGASDPSTVVSQLAAPRPAATGIALPAGTTTVTVPAEGTVSDVDLIAFVRLADGRDVPFGLLPTATGGLTGTLPTPATAGARLFGLTLTENSFAATHRQHHEGEGGTQLAALTGSITLGPPTFTPSGSAGAGGTWSGWGSDGAEVTAGDRLTFGYTLSGAKVVIRAGYTEAAPPIPAYADPVTAAAATNGALAVSVGNGPPIAVTVIGVLPRFPATGPRFLVADVHAVVDALDARDPGTGGITQLWLRADRPVAAVLAQAPFDLLRADVRQVQEDRLAADPLARGAAGLLTNSALLAFVVALLSLVLLVVADRRDESAQLYAWESDGVGPGTLRRSLFLRAVAVLAVGVPGGIAIGLLLSRITTALVRVTAVGGTPIPPLALAVTPLWTVMALVAGLVVGLAVCAGLAASALRERLPRRPEEDVA